MPLIPTVIEKNGQTERAYDIYSRLLRDRIIFLGEVIDEHVANTVIAQLLFLDADNKDQDIKLYINSPGGLVSAGLAIYDTIQFIKSDVSTICIGLAASMASFLLASGKPGKRFSLPNSEIMIHQILGGTRGQASDIKIHAEHILKLKSKINKILASHTGQKIATIERDSDRDNFMSAEEALKYGIIDKIIGKK